jgi:hypothetical protein
MLKNRDLNICSYITNIIMKLIQNSVYLSLLIFALAVSVSECAKVSPFSSVLYSPRRMYRSSFKII